MMRVICVLAALLSLACPLSAAATTVDALLPASFASGWAMDGKPAAYSPGTLYEYIDGEAELYLPYGFAKAATVMYLRTAGKDYGIVATIFQMGSLLDAFGIYASYRDPTAKQRDIGAEGFADESQLMFYQDRYFVRIETSGTVPGGADGPLQSAAEAISRNLPAGRERPRELEFLKSPGAIPLTERYYAAGLLGHNFFGRGMTAEVMLEGERVKSVVIFCASEEAAKRVFDDYGKYLKGEGAAPQIRAEKNGASLQVVDPLYKGVALRRSGRYVAGVMGLKEPRAGDSLAALLLGRLGADFPH
jgi:hypothetical protein